MRAFLASLLIAAAAGCSGGDDYPIGGGGGGGTGGHDTPADARPSGDGGASTDGGSTLAGQVCVVLDVGAPRACPAVAAARDVLVEELGGGSTRTDTTGGFTLDVAAGTPTVQVGSEVNDGLVTTRTKASGGALDAPAFDEVAWDTALSEIGEAQAGAAVIAYVTRGGAPVEGATLTLDGGTGGGRRYYDAPGGFSVDAVTTGPDGYAVFLDVTGSTVRATLDTAAGSADVSTTAGAIGVAFVELP